MSYKKLKDTWVVKEEYRNITGQFGLAPSQGQVYNAYAIGYDMPIVDSLGDENNLQDQTATGGLMDKALGYTSDYDKVFLGGCPMKNTGKRIIEIPGVT